MFSVTRIETDMIMSGKATGLLRKADSLPYEQGSEIVFTSEYLDGSGRQIPFAKAVVMTIRPATVGYFRRDQMIAEVNGYENPEIMIMNLSMMYGGVKDSDKAVHVKFKLTDVDKQAGLRGNVGDAKFEEIDGILTKIEEE